MTADERPFLYFAYGANTNRRGMEGRCPAAAFHRTCRLDGYRLVFRGVADIEPAAREAVQGVVWRVTPKCIDSLDAFEGYPVLYGRQLCDIGEEEQAFFYQMNEAGYGLPSTGYYGTLRQGYTDFGLPESELRAAYDWTRENVEDLVY
jgi:gamma-glutamylcyclotransferase (GGCT)/AIG2-like uncharacterized protein YtfP